MTDKSNRQDLFEHETPAKPQDPVECLGMTFENDEARREHFLGLLREGLEELHAKLGGVPFTTVEDAVERMKLVEKWPRSACPDLSACNAQTGGGPSLYTCLALRSRKNLRRQGGAT